MIDFEYSLPTLTIPEGTVVRFVNQGPSKHSVTADDGAFDSGLLNKAGEFTVNFDEAGFVPYFCILHGTKGNTGMSASVTVVGEGEEVPEPVEAEPPEQEETAEVAQFSIEMVDFTYSALEFVVPVGSEVTWFNTGEVEHSATSDDNLWDTTLLANGEQATLVFDSPGTFLYYCLLHGTPGGNGMAAQITVVEREEDQPPPEGEPPEGEGTPEATPPPEPNESPPEVVPVDMLDFWYGPVEITIPAGSSILWVNEGEFDHSATDDNGAWDTGVFGPGGEATSAFDTPGTYPYYCTLHGTPGGNGMSGTVTVTEE
jgi:plastocyanin